MNRRQLYNDDFDDPESPRSIYDGEEGEIEPWFLPDPDVALVDHEIPLPWADHTPLNDAGLWLLAQGHHAAKLATAVYGRGAARYAGRRDWAEGFGAPCLARG